MLKLKVEDDDSIMLKLKVKCYSIMLKLKVEDDSIMLILKVKYDSLMLRMMLNMIKLKMCP